MMLYNRDKKLLCQGQKCRTDIDSEVSLLTCVMKLIVLSGNSDLLKRVLFVISLNDESFSLNRPVKFHLRLIICAHLYPKSAE